MADFRAIYHLAPDQARELSAPEYFALAYRLPAYHGVMSARLETARQEARRSLPEGATEVPGTREGLTQAGIGDLFD